MHTTGHIILAAVLFFYTVSNRKAFCLERIFFQKTVKNTKNVSRSNAGPILMDEQNEGISRKKSATKFQESLQSANMYFQEQILQESTQSVQSKQNESLPTHLIVLVHGLAGAPDDLRYLREAIVREGGEQTLVHCATCNYHRTFDGIVQGGTRLANEIKEMVKLHSSLKEFSIVGNSLGGLYSRYAVSLLLDTNGSTFLDGLSPKIFMTIASPHLGVRRFTYIELPEFVHFVGDIAAGQTGRDLFMRDSKNSPLLFNMATTPEFLEPLKLFQDRRIYANVKGDFMVPFQTAAFAPSDDAWNDEEFITPFMELKDKKSFKKFGSFAPFGRSTENKIIWEYRTSTTKNVDQYLDELSHENLDRQGRNIETLMAKALDSCGWTKVGVDFGGILPFSHNMICALSRNGFTTQVFKAGMPVMDHAAKYLVSEVET